MPDEDLGERSTFVPSPRQKFGRKKLRICEMWTGFLSRIRYGSTGEYHATIGPHGTWGSGTAAVLTVYLSLPGCLYERVGRVVRQSTLRVTNSSALVWRQHGTMIKPDKSGSTAPPCGLNLLPVDVLGIRDFPCPCRNYIPW